MIFCGVWGMITRISGLRGCGSIPLRFVNGSPMVFEEGPMVAPEVGAE